MTDPLVDRVAQELMRLNPWLHGKEWRELKPVLQKLLRNDAERIIAIVRKA